MVLSKAGIDKMGRLTGVLSGMLGGAAEASVTWELVGAGGHISFMGKWQ